MQRILEKRERALGTKLSIKGDRCASPRCALIRKPHRPGQHGQKRQKKSEFGTQLQEKQKIRFTYGLTDKQLSDVFKRAVKKNEPTPQAVIKELESRIDSVVYALGLAPSRSAARKLVSHGHLMINDARVTIPSHKLGLNDILKIRPESKNIDQFKDISAKIKDVQAPSWLSFNKEKLEAKVVGEPESIDSPFDIGLVVDYYLR